MNVDRRPDLPVSLGLWDRYDMRMALAQRDVAAIFRLLQKNGVSQRRIATLTGQSQSEISEIMSGRQVMAYDVLVRICDGLGVPRGHMGLSYDDATAVMVDAAVAANSNGQMDEEPRRMIGRVVQVAIGAVELDPGSWWQPFERTATPAPERVGASDVERLERVTAVFRSMDSQFGGGACRDAMVAQVHSAQHLLHSSIAEGVAGRLFTALADLHCVVGWSSFDVGMYVPARLHYTRALEQARYAEQASLMAKVLYCIGRLHLYQGHHVDALRLFQLGQISAEQSGSGLATALLAANAGWAYAHLDDTRQALAALDHAKRAFDHGHDGGEPVPPWLRFMVTAELHSLEAMTHTASPDPTAMHSRATVEGLYAAIGLRGRSANRSRALETAALVEALLACGDKAGATKMLTDAVRLADHVRSSRVDLAVARLQRKFA
jgi:transcriptional regulator with XRE-family HTH domain